MRHGMSTDDFEEEKDYRYLAILHKKDESSFSPIYKLQSYL